MLVAHAGESHVETTGGLMSRLLHQPTWIGLFVVALIITTLYFITKLLKLSLPAQLLVMVSSLIIIGVIYMPHNPTVTGIVLSIGFIVTFLLTFTMLAKQR